MNTFRTRGFSAIETVIAIVVLGLIGALGYVAYTNFSGANTTSDTNTSSTTQTATKQAAIEKKLDARLAETKKQPTPVVESKTDLDKGLEALKDDDAFDTSSEAQQMKEMAATFLY